jgi:Glycosyl hydrolases family 11
MLGPHNPASSGKDMGRVTLDGSTYYIAQGTRVNQPSIDGNQTFKQFMSVRQTKRSRGTIDVGAHFRAWSNLGMNLGTNHSYQILACEGYFSVGRCNITVTDVGGATSTAASTSTADEAPVST